MSDMTLEQVNAVMEAAIKHKANGPAANEDEAKRIAKEVLGACMTSYTRGIRSDAVMDVLYAAKVQPTEAHDFVDVYARFNEQAPPQPQAQQAQAASAPAAVPAAFGGAPAAAPAPTPAPQPVATAPAPVPVAAPAPGVPAGFGAPAPAPVPAQPPAVVPEHSSQPSFDIESVFPSYDDYKARDIVEAITANAASGDLTPQEWELIKAYETANEGRKTIVELQPTFAAPTAPIPAAPAPAPGGFPGATTPEMISGATQVMAPQPVAAAPAPAQPTPPDAGGYQIEQAYVDGTLGSQRARQEAIPDPPQWQGGEPFVPVDITQVSPEELTRVSMQFDSLFARTKLLVSQEEGREKACAHLEGEYHRAAYARHHGALKAAIEKPSAAANEEARKQATHEADSDPEVTKWRALRVQHGIEAGDLKARLAGFESKIERLSREQSRREKISG